MSTNPRPDSPAPSSTSSMDEVSEASSTGSSDGEEESTTKSIFSQPMCDASISEDAASEDAVTFINALFPADEEPVVGAVAIDKLRRLLEDDEAGANLSGRSYALYFIQVHEFTSEDHFKEAVKFLLFEGPDPHLELKYTFPQDVHDVLESEIAEQYDQWIGMSNFEELGKYAGISPADVMRGSRALSYAGPHSPSRKSRRALHAVFEKSALHCVLIANAHHISPTRTGCQKHREGREGTPHFDAQVWNKIAAKVSAAFIAARCDKNPKLRSLLYERSEPVVDLSTPRGSYWFLP